MMNGGPNFAKMVVSREAGITQLETESTMGMPIVPPVWGCVDVDGPSSGIACWGRIRTTNPFSFSFFAELRYVAKISFFQTRGGKGEQDALFFFVLGVRCCFRPFVITLHWNANSAGSVRGWLSC